jgi:hypothetical protein
VHLRNWHIIWTTARYYIEGAIYFFLKKEAILFVPAAALAKALSLADSFFGRPLKNENQNNILWVKVNN